MKKTHQLKLSENSRQAAANGSASAVKNNLTAQLQDNRPKAVAQRKANTTGLPDNLKTGVENLSGHSMDDVRVHYHSSRPAQLRAHAYAQGTDIHIAPGQEKHLPHEAWHVVQQKQGRVKPTLQMKGKVNINDDKGLEKEADVMGAKALQMKAEMPVRLLATNKSQTIQRYLIVGDEDYTRRYKAAPGEPLGALTDEVYADLLNSLALGNPHELIVHTFLAANAAGKVKGQISKWIEDTPGLGAPHSRNADFGRKRQDRSYANPHQLALAIYGWVSSKPERSNEKRIADSVYANPVMDIHMNNIFKKLKVWIQTGGHGNVKAAQIETELKVAGVNAGGARTFDDYRQYFNHPPKGAIPQVPNTFWDVIDNPQNFNLREKISTFHDIMKYFMQGSGTQGDNMLPAEPDFKATTALNTRPDYNRPEMSRIRINGGGGLARVDLAGARADGHVQDSVEEADPTFRFARENQIPMWGRHSFTAARMMMLTQQIGGDKEEISASAWTTFAFWRKHYDHRSIPYHTLHEIMDFTPHFGLAYNPVNREAGLLENHNLEKELINFIFKKASLPGWSAKKSHLFRSRPKGLDKIRSEVKSGRANNVKLANIKTILNGRPATDKDRDAKTTEFYDLMKRIPDNLNSADAGVIAANKITLTTLLNDVNAFTL